MTTSMLFGYERLDVVVVTAILAILGKHVFRLGGVHVFNSAALTLVVSAVVLGTGQSWWTALPELGGVGALVVVVSGICIAKRLNKLPMIVAFLGTYFALLTASAVLGAPSQVAETSARLTCRPCCSSHSSCWTTRPHRPFGHAIVRVRDARRSHRLRRVYAARVGLLPPRRTPTREPCRGGPTHAGQVATLCPPTTLRSALGRPDSGRRSGSLFARRGTSGYRRRGSGSTFAPAGPNARAGGLYRGFGIFACRPSTARRVIIAVTRVGLSAIARKPLWFER